jgi:hypothetical protein
MSEPAQILEDDSGLQKRRAPRDEVALPTRMLDAERRAADVLLVNISPLGFMVREYGATPKGAVVRLVLPRLGELEATIVWSLGGRIGAEFTKPIDPYAYAAMLNAARSRRQRWPMG